MKKKLRDCTYGEMQRYCESASCKKCPLRNPITKCDLVNYPSYYEGKMLDTEIDIPEEELK